MYIYIYIYICIHKFISYIENKIVYLQISSYGSIEAVYTFCHL